MKNAPKRTIICTFVALSSGIFGMWVGSQVSTFYRSQSCYQNWGRLQILCDSWVKPAALWQGSSTGLWTGTILGAFIAGLATSKTNNNE